MAKGKPPANPFPKGNKPANAYKTGQTGNPRGRPKGTVNKRSAELAAQARSRGLEPLQVMLDAMEDFLGRAKRAKKAEEKITWMREALDVAQMAAPYCHAKLRHVEVGGQLDISQTYKTMTDEQLAATLAAELAKLGATAPAPVLRLINGGKSAAAAA